MGNKKANKILNILKDEILLTMWYDEQDQFFSEKMLFPFYEEDTIYQIKKLKMDKEMESFYIEKIHNILGPFSEY